MDKEGSFSAIYKEVTYEDILLYKRYKKLSFLKGYSLEEIAKHLYAQEFISQDKWKALKILNRKLFSRKERLKRQKIAKSSICFEFQVVVAVVGFKWHRRGNAKNAD